ncbi:MAG: flagellar export chaperone FliS [Planctomycetota bacterium]|jgi:flagellar secretion chaperone FliS|nr:flagellar export chaperone FliS [Planctomycetota bacterium]MDG2143215.1 flagellar export chaperone FliS [Planctomycetota bacterium]
MSISDPTTAYKMAAIENAPPLKIVRMLYQGCLRFLGQASEAYSSGDFPRFTERVGKAEAIISELRCSLDSEAAPEICHELEGLYLYTSSRMIQAIADQSDERVEEARSVVQTLLTAWNDLEMRPS